MRFGPPGFEEAAAEDDLPEGKARELVASRKALALEARDATFFGAGYSTGLVANATRRPAGCQERGVYPRVASAMCCDTISVCRSKHA